MGKSFDSAEWLPKCEVSYDTNAVVRDRASGVAIHDSAGSTHFDNSSLKRAFKTPRIVDMNVEVNLAEEPSSQRLSWEESGDSFGPSRDERISGSLCEA